MRLCLYLLAGVLHFANFALTQSSQEIIKINQSGYYPNAPKVAVVTGDFTTEEYSRENLTFYILKTNGADTAFKKTLGKVLQSTNSSLKTRIADFSELKQPGNYLIYVPGIGTSYPFEIKENVHRSTANSVLKGFYFQRV